MESNSTKNNILIFELSNKIHDIKNHLRDFLFSKIYPDQAASYITTGYLDNTKATKNIKVVFTLRDEHIWNPGLPMWRYWIGLDEHDINEIPKKSPDLKKKLQIFWGHDEKTKSISTHNAPDIAPNVFFPGIDFSPKMEPGKNWFLTRIPKDLTKERASYNALFYYHTDFEEKDFISFVTNFFDIIISKNKLGNKYHHVENLDDRFKKIEALLKAAKDAYHKSFSNKNTAIAKKIESFTKIPDVPNLNKEPFSFQIFRYLMRAIDYYFLYKNYDYLLGYGLTVGGYHIATFFIIIKQAPSKENYFFPLEEKYCLDEMKSIDEIIDIWENCYQRPIVPSLKNKRNEFIKLLGEIDSIIKLGWTEAVNSVLAKLATTGSKGNVNKYNVIDEAIRSMLLMDNQNTKPDASKNNQSCPFSCADKSEIKYIIHEFQNEINECICEQCKNENFKCLCIPILKDEETKRILHVFFRNWPGTDEISSKIILKSMIENFIKYYTTIILPMRNEMIKSAFAQVNVRTSSHNTGSHILAQEFSEEDKKDIPDFLTYLRHRMLYNSDITTGIASFEIDYSLKDIIDEFKSMKIVKKYISGLFDCVFADFDLNENDEKRNISVPNGVLGLQAFFIIFENIIRNYFKHAAGNNNKLKVSLGLEGETDDHICLTLSDGSTPTKKQYERIRKLIEDPILEDNKLRHEGLGFLEMKGAACYLNKIPMEQIDEYKVQTINNGKKEPQKVFEAIRDNKSENKLKFNLWLRKPKKLLIFTDDPQEKTSYALNNNGIYFKSNVNNSQNEPHQWVIMNNKTQLKNNNTTSISQRVFSVNHEGKNWPMLSDEVYNKILTDGTNVNELLYPKWVEFLLKKKNIENKSLSILWLKQFSNKEPYIFKLTQDSEMPLYEIPKNESEQSLQIIFDNHGTHYGEFSNPFYYEPFSSNVGIGPRITDHNALSVCEKTILYYELIELAVSKVIILDERVQRKLNENVSENLIVGSSTNNIKIKKVFERMNIHNPDPSSEEANLNSEDFEKNKVLEKIKNWIYHHKDGLDYLIIHLGIIEKFLKTNKTSDHVKNWIEENIKPELDAHYNTSIIITTERGTPDNIPSSCRFLHYSNLVKYLFEDQSKYHLMKTIISSRKIS